MSKLPSKKPWRRKRGALEVGGGVSKTNTKASKKDLDRLMKTAAIKKCERKLSHLFRLIKNKENENTEISKNIQSLVDELKSLKKSLDQTRADINKVHSEKQTIRENLDKTDQKIVKIRTSLPYRTRNQYLTMIAQLERERNTRHYNSNEEARLLRDLSHYEQCLKQFDIYVEKQAENENLKRALSDKKLEYDNLWNQSRAIGEQFTVKNENLNKLKESKKSIKEELRMLHQQTFDIKKELEDLKREKVINERNEKNDCSSNQDMEALILEKDLKDVNKLINYFSKLHSVQNPCLSNSSNDPDTTDYQGHNELTKPTFLQLSKSYKSEDFTGTPSPNSLSQCSTFPLLNTPTPVEDKCPEGMFMLKKKIDGDEIESKSWKKKTWKKSKQNACQKCSHSVEIINLLAKFGIPLKLSSHVDQCINELNQRRNQLETKLVDRKSEINKSKEACCSKDNQSVVSSLMDSNYESDTNSVCQANFDNDLTLTGNDLLELDLPSLESSKSSSSSNSDKTLKQSPKLVINNSFLRQISDGYSSTCLSADSMSSELQAAGKTQEANPFFK